MPPRTLGPYEILSVIGRGGIGTVYRARHRDSGEAVAVKLLGPPPACDPIAARRLAREFEALQGLSHPHVVRVYGAGVHEGYSYLAMELVEGLDLRSYLSPLVDEVEAPTPAEPATPLGSFGDEPETAGHGPSGDPGAGPEAIRAFAALMDEPETDPGQWVRDTGDLVRGAPALAEARPLAPAVLERLNRPARVARLRDALLQVCDGLGYVHARGLVHRDLKPSNIMVDDARRVRLMDFGLVKLESDALHLTQHGRVVGTYRYMSPEQAKGEPVDGRSDLYSVGVILFELLAGRPPFTARRPAELWRDIVSRPAPAVASVNPDADGRLAAAAERLLRKEPRERFADAAELAAAIA
ncbi:MAG TPA: serine/threonine-protein kinase [Anaeromyxobacteraceae bacterium]|nr:serine/threonine-protein kinase [Anaeromyxobacteraceae bacterium]